MITDKERILSAAAKVERLKDHGDPDFYMTSFTIAEARALVNRVIRLESRMEAIITGDTPRPLGVAYREDKVPSKLDRCKHNFYLYEDCYGCVVDFLGKALDYDG